MLQLKNIRKAYVTDSFTQVALDDVSVTFRDNEFVAILGPSGSGKTTMLNILGGLDHADSGDIVVNGTSTKDFGSKDWDTYRNHRVGFVFQSYNLIPHQSILSNVELALTLSGVGRSERRARAREALERVGLGEHLHKRPSQLSGGQMQRVAIARALVNDPDIVLADEPTGALDSETGVQVMDILKGVARDRLVVMVTHNPELAEAYATRIVRVRDGRIEGDSDPLRPEGLGTARAGASGAMAGVSGPASATAGPGERDASKPGRHASMSFATALSLSFNNLMTKKGRTFLTAFAGSIGIIGIAAILALSNGVNGYIKDTEESSLASYPLTITKSSFDVSSLLGSGIAGGSSGGEAQQASADAGTIGQDKVMTDMFAQVKNNDLSSFKAFLEGGQSGIEPYVNTIKYSYGVTPQIYEADTSAGVTRLNPSEVTTKIASGVMGSALTGGTTNSSFNELVSDQKMLDDQMEVVAGSWPKAADEAVLVLDANGRISDYTLYSLGFYDTEAMNDMMSQMLGGKEVEVPDDYRDFSYDDAMGMSFKVVPATALYQRNDSTGGWTDMSADDGFLRSAVDEGLDLRVVGVVKPRSVSSSSLVREGVGYTAALTNELIQEAADSDIVKEQVAKPDTDVFTGKSFEELQQKQGKELDMGSLFTVDESALKSAFSFDASAISGLSSGMDLGSLDLSGLAPDASGFDMSSVRLDTSQLSGVFSAQSMAALMAGAPRFDLAKSGITDALSGLSDEQRAQLGDEANELGSGFAAWAGSRLVPSDGAQVDYASLVQEYLQTDAAKATIAKLQEGFGSSMGDVAGQAMQKYLQEQLAPYFSNAMQALVRQAAQVMATQLASQLQTQMAAATSKLGTQLSDAIAGKIQSQMSSLSSALQSGFSVDAGAFSRAIKVNMSQDDLSSLLQNYMNAEDLSYDANMRKLGYARLDDPESISIYPRDFDTKKSVEGVIDSYNRGEEAAGKPDSTIQYSDLVGALMSSVTDIVNMISTVLIAFVSISLVVSSVMIAIITYISVLERKKEIGILRAMGASRLNVANIFNAETVIEGLLSGVFAVGLVYLASVPVNAFVLGWKGVPNIMVLPWQSALALVAISVGLTLVAGLIPSSMAARRDPVEALRSE